MRFYFDNESSASVEIPAFDLMKAGFNLGPGLLQPHSSYDSINKGGQHSILPIPYQKHCKITWEILTRQTLNSHDTINNYRTYEAGTQVITFKKEDLIKEKALIDSTEYSYGILLLTRLIKVSQQAKPLKPEKKFQFNYRKVHFYPVNGLNITTLKQENKAQALRSTILKIVFDGEEQYGARWRFFGKCVGGQLIKSWYREARGEKIISRWIMPYKKSATIYFINTSNVPVQVEANVNVEALQWTNNTMYFHTSWKHETNIEDRKWDYDVNKIASLIRLHL